MGSNTLDTSTIRRALTSAWQKRQHDEARRCTSGSECLRAFEARSRLRGKINEQVSQRDREKIAYALHLELERLETHPDLTRRAFSRRAVMIESGIARVDDLRPTKRLRELTLDPSLLDDQAIGRRRNCLCKGYPPYLQLIHAVLKFTKEDGDAVCTRIFAGTSFSGLETDVNRNRQLAWRLKESVGRTNSQFGQCGPRRTLEQLFEATASLKKQAQKSGDLKNWPFIDGDAPYWANGDEVPNWESPYWSKFIRGLAVHSHCVQSGGYLEMQATSLSWEDAVVFLPRAYLGCAIYFKGWNVEGEDHAEWLQGLFQAQAQITEVRCLDEGGRSVQYRDAEGQYAPRPRTDSIAEGDGQCWLVIYPAPDGRGLCPVLYWCQGEGGVHVCVLADENIDILSTFHVCNTAEHGVESLFDRIHRLAIGDSGQLEIEWMRTAFDLLENPFLRTRPAAPTLPASQGAD